MLELISFICGASVMVMEMAGSRLLAPHLGTSIVVWTALIGVILASLSVGYWLGGKAGDRNPNPATLSKIILGAATFVLVAAFLQASLLPTLTGMSLELSAIVAASLLFTIPSILLGMVSPYIIQVKLALMKSKDKSGAVIGRFYALSTLGSILGTFLGGYYLIAWLGTRTILYAVAGTLAFAAILAASQSKKKIEGKKRSMMSMTVILVMAFGGGAWASADADKDLSQGILRDTRYNSLKIQEGYIGKYSSRMRFLVTDPGSIQSGMLISEPNELALDYTRFYALAWHIVPEAKKFLMLGGGGYSVPKYLLHTRQDALVDVVEIDPGITAAAHEFFALPKDPRLTVYDEDARVFLNRSSSTAASGSGRYDIIMGDTFTSSYNIPFHLGTVECARLILSLLEDDGVFACNIISSVNGDTGQVFRSIHAAFASVFPQTHVFAVSDKRNGFEVQNLMLVALKKPRPLPLAWNAEMQTLLDAEWRLPIAADTPPLTDDYGPVERYAMAILRKE